MNLERLPAESLHRSECEEQRPGNESAGTTCPRDGRAPKDTVDARTGGETRFPREFSQHRVLHFLSAHGVHGFCISDLIWISGSSTHSSSL